ncbi:ABC transporter substrate-binding protein [Kutzneria viridogrisea]|uniref:NitT/TauT family transport system substrate-binding protein n=1 Tax=Kutzneria viridogrisea TaxID=47990 RepID=A0ABR6BW01_9PSEU|nr:NitT/TauT family transport system substrate-binding protein [Kutzneria viridogrisea]
MAIGAVRRTAVLLAGVLGLSVTASGCSLMSSGSSGSPSLEHPTLRVGYEAQVDVAPLYKAVNSGLFADAGLRIELQQEPSDADAIKALSDGKLDVAFATHVSLFKAAGAGTQLQLQGEAYQAGANTMALVSLPSLGYDDPSQKPSPRIAVNAPDDLGVLTTKSVLDTAGVAQNKIQFKTVPFATMADALQNREVDAAWMVEPFITKAQKALGATIVTDAARGATLDFPISGYASLKKFADGNPNTMSTFRKVLAQAQQQASDRLQVQTVLKDYAGVDAATADLISVGSFPTTLNAVRLQRVADMMQTSQMLANRLDVQSMMPPNEQRG